MTAAFVYLVACSYKNTLRSRLKRLRQPRYTLGLVVGAIYFYFVLFRPSARPSGANPFALLLRDGNAPLLAGLSVLLLFFVALFWLVRRQLMAFTQAEVQFLFAAPITRRQLIHYKLVRGQVAGLLSSVIFAIILRPGRAASGLPTLLGIWLVFGLINLHTTGIALSRTSLAEHGASGWRRFGLPALVVVSAFLTLVGVVVLDWPTLAGLSSGREVVSEMVRLATTGAGGVVLWPFRVMAALPFAASMGEFVRALPPVLALYVVNYVWVVRADAAFEEASAESAERRARSSPAARPRTVKTLRTPFRLAAHGRIETAILWKNLILLGRFSSRRLFFSIFPMVIVLGVMASQASRHGIGEALGVLCITCLFMTLLAGPMMVRNDLRRDLAHVAQLKTWPVSGAVIIRGEVLAPALILSCLALVLIVAGAAFIGGTLVRSVGAGDVLAFVAVALVLSPPLLLGQVVMQNAIAVLFPSWAVISGARAAGIDAMGQRILLMIGTMLGLVVGLIPAAVAAAIAGFGLYFAAGRVMIVIPALVGAAVILVECWLATELLGLVLDRTDVSAVDAQER
jgi:ABC-2 type transport system permease protein